MSDIGGAIFIILSAIFMILFFSVALWISHQCDLIDQKRNENVEKRLLILERKIL